MTERPIEGKKAVEFRMPDGRYGHLVPNADGIYEVYVEPKFCARPDRSQLSIEQRMEITRRQGQRHTKWERFPKEDTVVFSDD